jgi:hypothetical protein
MERDTPGTERHPPTEQRFRLGELELVFSSGVADRLTTDTTNAGERRLIAALLADAVWAYARHRDGRHAEATLLKDARRWIESTDRVWALSFERVCESLELEPNMIREQLRRLRAEDAPR